MGLVAVLVVAHNALVVAGIGEAWMFVVNVIAAVVLIGAARRAGMDDDDIGIRIHRRGWIAAAVIAIVAALVVVTAAGLGVRPEDEAVAELSPSARWFRALVSIPVGTALCEEVIFRGVLLAAGDRLTTRWGSTALVSVLFGLWHLAAEVQRTGSSGPAAWPGVFATAAASALFLCPLRRHAGDLAAPVTLHLVVNVGVFTLVALGSTVPG